MADTVSTIAEAVNKAISETAWSKSAIAEEMELKPQGLNDKLMRNKNPKIDFITKLLGIVGFRLVVLPKGARLPQGSIVIDPCAEDACTEGGNPEDAPKSPMKPANWTEPDGAATHRRDWTDKYYGGGE